jgi:hypothetical protein
MKFRHQAYQFVPAVVLVCGLLPPPAEAQFFQQGPKLVGTGGVGVTAQGSSVSLSGDGNTAVVGGFADNGDVGAAWVFTRSAGLWSQRAKLVGTGAVGGSLQGSSVSISADGNTAIIGGLGDNNSVGAAWVFTRSTNGAWSQQGPKLVGTGAVGDSLQGVVSISADGNTAIIGGPGDNNLVGAAWVFTRSTSGVWSQQGPSLVGLDTVGGFAAEGSSVSISADGNTAIIGGPYDDNQAGAALISAGSVVPEPVGRVVGAIGERCQPLPLC